MKTWQKVAPNAALGLGEGSLKLTDEEAAVLAGKQGVASCWVSFQQYFVAKEDG